MAAEIRSNNINFYGYEVLEGNPKKFIEEVITQMYFSDVTVLTAKFEAPSKSSMIDS